MAMKKIKVPEATGPVLDWMVAVCQERARVFREVILRHEPHLNSA